MAAMRLAQPEMITASRQLKQAIVDMEYESVSRQNSPLLANHRRIDEHEEPHTPLLMHVDSSRAGGSHKQWAKNQTVVGEKIKFVGNEMWRPIFRQNVCG